MKGACASVSTKHAASLTVSINFSVVRGISFSYSPLRWVTGSSFFPGHLYPIYCVLGLRQVQAPCIVEELWGLLFYGIFSRSVYVGLVRWFWISFCCDPVNLISAVLSSPQIYYSLSLMLLLNVRSSWYFHDVGMETGLSYLCQQRQTTTSTEGAVNIIRHNYILSWDNSPWCGRPSLSLSWDNFPSELKIFPLESQPCILILIVI